MGPSLLLGASRGDDAPEHIPDQFLIGAGFTCDPCRAAHDLGFLGWIQHRQLERLFQASDFQHEIPALRNELDQLPIELVDTVAKVVESRTVVSHEGATCP